MPVHDWTRATPGMFPDFHLSWLAYLKRALNQGLLPKGYYAMAEQKTGVYGPDVLALTADPRTDPAGGNGAVAVAEPRAARRVVAKAVPVVGRVITVRHATGHRMVAVIEVVSPRNKDRARSVGAFAEKVAGLVRAGVHVAVVDILPPGRHDPTGLHPVIWRGLDTRPPVAGPPADLPLTFAGYRADEYQPVAYLNYAAVGQPLPAVPLFLDDGVFVDVPLEETYMTNFNELPPELQAVLV